MKSIFKNLIQVECHHVENKKGVTEILKLLLKYNGTFSDTPQQDIELYYFKKMSEHLLQYKNHPDNLDNFIKIIQDKKMQPCLTKTHDGLRKDDQVGLLDDFFKGMPIDEEQEELYSKEDINTFKYLHENKAYTKQTHLYLALDNYAYFILENHKTTIQQQLNKNPQEIVESICLGIIKHQKATKKQGAVVYKIIDWLLKTNPNHLDFSHTSIGKELGTLSYFLHQAKEKPSKQSTLDACKNLFSFLLTKNKSLKNKKQLPQETLTTILEQTAYNKDFVAIHNQLLQAGAHPDGLSTTSYEGGLIEAYQADNTATFELLLKSPKIFTQEKYSFKDLLEETRGERSLPYLQKLLDYAQKNKSKHQKMKSIFKDLLEAEYKDDENKDVDLNQEPQQAPTSQ